MMIVAVIVVVRLMRVRTGLIQGFSTPGLAGMSAAGLSVTDLDPVVAQQQVQLATQRHRLAQVGDEKPRSRSHAH